MNDLYIYLLKVSAILALFYGIYHFFLQDEKFYRGIRLYLASSLLLSFVLPLVEMDFTISEAANSSNIVLLLNAINIGTEGDQTTSLLQNISLTQVFIGLYIFICFILTVRSIIRISKTQKIISNNPSDEFEGQKLIKVDENTPNFSFLGKIVVSDKDFNTESFRNIIAHEKIHVEQKHWIDLLLVELTTILLWFNPFAWLFERAIKQTHELLADEGVIAQGCNIGQYQASILNQIMGTEIMGLANNFNYSITKKRLIMMTKTNTSKNRIFKLLLVIPAIALALTLNLKCASNNHIPNDKQVVKITNMESGTSTEVVDGITTVKDANGDVLSSSMEIKTATGSKTVSIICDEMPEFPGGPEALQAWINENVNYPKEAVKKNIVGRVYVSFIVNENGVVENTTIARGVSPSLDVEALRVVSSMPKWKPGKEDGEAVSVAFTVPINFALK